MGNKKEVKRAEAKAEAKKNVNLLLTVEKTGEKVVYSKDVHGDEYKDIAKATAEKFGGTLTEIKE